MFKQTIDSEQAIHIHQKALILAYNSHKAASSEHKTGESMVMHQGHISRRPKMVQVNK